MVSQTKAKASTAHSRFLGEKLDPSKTHLIPSAGVSQIKEYGFHGLQ